MKLQSLTIIFIIIVLPVSLVLSAYIGFELKTIEKQNTYNSGVVSATHDAIFSFEMNTNSDNYSNNPETKRDIIKSAVKTFENSLSTTCNLGLYGNSAIEQYIPAIVFGMYDGFYMYAPYKTSDGYRHDLRNYVYYSEQLPNSDITIRYSLDNYVAVSGTIGSKYITKAGYLINLEECRNYNYNNNKAELESDFSYFDVNIVKENLKYNKYDSNQKVIHTNVADINNSNALTYFKNAIEFTQWFLNEAKLGDNIDYLNISNNNDPEDENSIFVQHKKQIIKEKIQNILNSSITAYAAKSGRNYKMPAFTEEDWQRIYSNISVITFVQGMNLGFKNYNSYCILNSTNNNEYVNPNLLYFTDGVEYHNIRCEKLNEATSITGYKIGDFEKTKVEVYENMESTETKELYYYRHDETACYDCINGTLNSNESVYNYVRDSNTPGKIKASYFLALAREREKTTKLSDRLNINY